MKVAIVGGGTMGSGIAAHLANLGFEVALIDLQLERAQAGIDRARVASPAAFMTPDKVLSVTPHALDDSGKILAEADWVCEAVVERLDVKRPLLQFLDETVKTDCFITTNTSGLPISELTSDRSDSFRRRFVGAHFFNPPRYLKLLELIPTIDTASSEIARLTSFLESSVARRVVIAKDTPGFIANRYGMWALYQGIATAEKLGFSVELTDLISGMFIGRPKSGTFRLADIIGLDVMADIAENLQTRCPDDPAISAFRDPASIDYLRGRGWLGEKTGQGYYRREAKERFSLDLGTLAYRMHQTPEVASMLELAKKPLFERIQLGLELRDEVGEYLRGHLIPALQYAATIQPEISHNVQDFDRVMRWGFGWELGPFEILDGLGSASPIPARKHYSNKAPLDANGHPIPLPLEPEFIAVSDLHVRSSLKFFETRDLGDGVTGIVTKTKMGVLSPPAIDEFAAFLEKGESNRLVWTSSARAFSAGFDLVELTKNLEAGDFDEIERSILRLQNLGKLLEQVPIVTAIFGHCLGAGLELALSTSTIVANAETKIGFPESRVGLIPGGRGTALMRANHSGSAKTLVDAALTLAEGKVAQNALEARTLGYLRASDIVVFHPDRLIYEAKLAALEARPHIPADWQTPDGPLAGMIDRGLSEQRTKLGFSDHDVLIGEKIKGVFVRSTDFEDAVFRERTEFVELCKKNLTQVRIKHMLEFGRPMKN